MEGFGKEQLLDILSRAVGPGQAGTAFEAFHSSSSVSVRVNPSKVPDPQAFVRGRFGEDCARVPWHPLGWFLEERPVFTLDPLFHAGCYYVQDSSAMAAGACFRKLLPSLVEELEEGSSGKGHLRSGKKAAAPGREAPSNRRRPLRVLDLCAAPGGKTTDLVSSLRSELGDGFILVANEVMRSRVSVLADNVALWGDPNVVVTSVDPKAFAAFEGFFDLVLADVPCSGEGMFRKDAKAVEDWSPEAVKLCSLRQRRILADVWPALRSGGRLIYSTCTFEEDENDSNVEWAAQELGAAVVEPLAEDFEGVVRTRTGVLLVPGLVKGEGQFVSALVKTSESGEPRLPSRCKGSRRLKGDLLIHVPESILAEVEELESLRPVQSGVSCGVRKGSDLVPSADLALSLHLKDCGEDFPRAELEREDALRFLHRDTIVVKDIPKGFAVVCHEGHPLGFVKNLGTRCNNLHPQGRRIRMDIQ